MAHSSITSFIREITQRRIVSFLHRTQRNKIQLATPPGPCFAKMDMSVCCIWYSWKRCDIRCVIFRYLSMQFRAQDDCTNTAIIATSVTRHYIYLDSLLKSWAPRLKVLMLIVISVNIKNYYVFNHMMLCVSAAIAVVSIVSKRIKISSNFFLGFVAPMVF